jgi:toxin CcdB
MRQFDVCENPDAASRAHFPFLLVVQADLLASLQTRVVVPLAVPDVVGRRPVGRLMPVLEVRGETLVAVVPELAGVALADLGPVVANVADRRSDIVAALDLLVTGA